MEAPAEPPVAAPADDADDTVVDESRTQTEIVHKRLDAYMRSSYEHALSIAKVVFRNHQDAEDVVAEAAARAIKSASTYDPARSFDPWFEKVVRNMAYHMWRARSARKRSHIISESDLFSTTTIAFKSPRKHANASYTGLDVLTGYAFSIVDESCVNSLDAVCVDADDISLGGAGFDGMITRYDLAMAMGRLSTYDRDILIAIYVRGMEPQSAVAFFGVQTVSTFRARLTAARKALRGALTDVQEELKQQ